jgi:membrane-bound metal-dependent hydrolase YbcI (DUF457 family)
MIQFAHFATGALCHYFLPKHKRSIFTLVLFGFIGMLPDADLFIPFLEHRSYMHGLFFILLVAAACTYIFKTWRAGLAGGSAIILHILGDVLDLYPVQVLPGMFLDWNPFNVLPGVDGGSSLSRVVLSMAVFTISFLIILVVEARYEYIQRRQD